MPAEEVEEIEVAGDSGSGGAGPASFPPAPAGVSEKFEAWLAYRRGEGPLPDALTLLIPWLTEASDAAGSADAAFHLATLYDDGVGGVPLCPDLAFRYFSRGAHAGHAFSQHRLGVLYRLGVGCARDYAVALGWTMKAVDQGLARAVNALGYCAHTGQGLPLSLRRAADYYRQAADMGDPLACANLGVLHSNSTERDSGVPHDEGLALYYFQRATELGQCPHALELLGNAYEYGRGTPADAAKAREYYRRAADEGNASGRYSLGRLAEHGLCGTPANPSEALRWYREAATQGHDEARQGVERLERRGIR